MRAEKKIDQKFKRLRSCLKIQAWFRMLLCKKQLLQLKRQKAALIIQKHARRMLAVRLRRSLLKHKMSTKV